MKDQASAALQRVLKDRAAFRLGVLSRPAPTPPQRSHREGARTTAYHGSVAHATAGQPQSPVVPAAPPLTPPNLILATLVDSSGLIMALALSAHVAEFSTTWVMCDESGQQMGPWQLQRDFRKARAKVQGLPDEFRFHELRHYFASLLIAPNLDVKTFQIRLRHASAKTTLDTYGHLWPDSDDSTRAAIDVVMTARAWRVLRTFAD
jgi:hypothetical protein